MLCAIKFYLLTYLRGQGEKGLSICGHPHCHPLC